MRFLRFACPSCKRLNDRRRLNGKESQEGRQESSQEGQVTPTRSQIWYCRGVAAIRGAFFVVEDRKNQHIAYTYDQLNRLTVKTYPDTTTVNYTSDNNGNTLTSVAGSNTTTYAWDYENRLTSVTLPGSGGTVSFKYDPFGRRIYKSSGAGTSVYAYDGDNLVEETNSSGTAVA
jgi:YD repeat-containing protein